MCSIMINLCMPIREILHIEIVKFSIALYRLNLITVLFSEDQLAGRDRELCIEFGRRENTLKKVRRKLSFIN